jgi:hypothetical protein
VRKAYLKGAPDFEKVLQECTEAIVSEVDALKNLVDEFAQFARLPAANLVAGSLHDIIEQTLSLYDGLFSGITMERRLGTDVPALRLDPDQMKRVLINLVDNAIDATDKRGGSPSPPSSTVRRAASGWCRRRRAGHPAGHARQAVRPALLHQEARERPRPGHRQPHRSGAPRSHPGGGDPSPRRPVRDRAAGMRLKRAFSAAEALLRRRARIHSGRGV